MVDGLKWPKAYQKQSIHGTIVTHIAHVERLAQNMHVHDKK